jgi:hypothetical protein
LITNRDAEIVEEVQDAATSRFITVECADELMLSNLMIDQGDGYRRFSPLFVRIDGVEIDLPAEVAAGAHIIELLGEPFSGVGLAAVGIGMHSVTHLVAGGVDPVLASKVAAIPQYYEGDGPPEDNPDVVGALNGARYKDRVNKIRYELSEGTWLQLAS